MKVLLIDLSAVFWRSWHASKDQSIGAAFEYTVNRINSIRHGYDHTAVCCDFPPYKRKTISSEYKAQRDVPDPAAVGQLRRVKERLATDGLLLWEALGYEADDVIATACHLLQKDAGDETDLAIDILTADKDIMALVNDRVTVVHLSTGDRFTPTEVEAKLGVPPGGIDELLALTGDTSDNVPGCPGVGPKKSAQLLLDNGGLQNVLNPEHALIAQPAVKAAVEQNRAQIAMSWELVKLLVDAPIDINELFEAREQKPLGEEIKDEEFEVMTTDNIEQAQIATDPPTQEQIATMPVHQAENQIAKVEPTGVIAQFETSLEPRTTGQAWALAKAIHSSRLFAVESPEAALMILMTGREMGIGAMSSMRGFHFIKGKPCLSSQLMSALILRSGRAEYWELIESSAKSATYATKRVGGRNEQKKTFTIDDAKIAQLVKQDSNWLKYPTSMCEARSAAMLARIVYPDLLMGVYLPDELDEAT